MQRGMCIVSIVMVMGMKASITPLPSPSVMLFTAITHYPIASWDRAIYSNVLSCHKMAIVEHAVFGVWSVSFCFAPRSWIFFLSNWLSIAIWDCLCIASPLAIVHFILIIYKKIIVHLELRHRTRKYFDYWARIYISRTHLYGVLLQSAQSLYDPTRTILQPITWLTGLKIEVEEMALKDLVDMKQLEYLLRISILAAQMSGQGYPGFTDYCLSAYGYLARMWQVILIIIFPPILSLLLYSALNWGPFFDLSKHFALRNTLVGFRFRP